MSQEFTVTIDQFQGPLDLMLHLIREKKLDLFNLDLDVLADQYIAYIHQMEKLNLEIAGDYLAEMAGLVEYKSRRLLPKPPGDLEDNYEEDTREALIQRLLEYQRYKEVTAAFQALREERSLQYDKPESEVAEFYRRQGGQESGPREGTMAELLKAMNQCIRRYQIAQPLPVSVAHKEISMEEREGQLRGIIRRLGRQFTLEDLCADCRDVYLVIVTFLAVLDMMKNGELAAGSSGGSVLLRRGAEYGQHAGSH